MIRVSISVFVIALVCFLSGFYAGIGAERNEWCRVTNKELAKFEECVKRGKP